MPNNRMMSLLLELIKNSKRSDRDLARIIDVSQPTLTRMRKKLERENYILDYTIIPNMTKLGFEIVAFTFLNVQKYDAKMGDLGAAIGERAHKWVSHNSKIMVAAGGEGLEGKNCVMISAHRDFTDFADFISDFRAHMADSIKEMDTFLVSLKVKMPKPFSFRNLEITF